MENGHINGETGEIFPSISETAIAARKERDLAEEADALGLGQLRLDAALMASVMELPAWITTDKVNPAFKAKYASLKAILETVRPVLHRHGIRIRQGTTKSWTLDEGGGAKGRLVPVFTDLVHSESGEVQRTEVEMPLTKMDPGAMSSAISYGQRKTLLMGLGLTTDEADDDGEGARTTNLSDKQQKSVELLALLKEIDAFKSATDLAEWGQDKKQTGRLNRLTEAERALAHENYNTKAQALLGAPEEEAAPKKGAK